MKIHTVAIGDTVSKIAKFYGTCETDIEELNGIKNGKISVGEELLVLTPTRVHTAKHGDTVERICLRYRLRKSDLLALNPSLCKKKPIVGQRIALKYDERTHGMAVTNGYVYRGTTADALESVLPFMTYVTFASLMADKNGMHKIFDEENFLEIIKKENKTPILKVHDVWNERYSNKDALTAFCDKLIEHAKQYGYKGILLNSATHSHSAEDYISFIMNFKKRMIGSDLILFTECDENTPSEFNEIADGSILSYTKLWDDDILSFDDGEKKTISNFACNSESIKSLIELPAFGRLGDGFIEIDKAKQDARNENKETLFDTKTKTASFQTKRGKCVYTPLSNIKAVLELLSEYGYMGISFDVMRTPREFLSMYNAMYKTVNYTSPLSQWM